MSIEFILRIVGMFFVAIIAGVWGYGLGGQNLSESIRYAAIIGLLGALTGLVLTPYITTRPARTIRAGLGRLSAETLFAGLTGLIVGLLTGLGSGGLVLLKYYDRWRGRHRSDATS